jgi:glucan biosynthesis protein C
MSSAYWVYIIHLPIVALIPGLLAWVPLPSGIKFVITFSVTSIFCFASYKYFVRGTFIELFLNGKMHKEKKLK